MTIIRRTTGLLPLLVTTTLLSGCQDDASDLELLESELTVSVTDPSSNVGVTVWSNGLSYIDDGDFVAYPKVGTIDFGDGTVYSTWTLSYATPYSDNRIELHLDGPAGPSVGELVTKRSGVAWSDYQNVTTPFTQPITGQHRLFLKFVGAANRKHCVDTCWSSPQPLAGCAAAAENGCGYGIANISALNLDEQVVPPTRDSDCKSGTTLVGGICVACKAASVALSTSTSTDAVAFQRIDLVAVVSSAQGTPSGVVTVSSGGTPLGSSLLVNGTATLTTTALGAGNSELKAEFQGSGYCPATSPIIVRHAKKASVALSIALDSGFVVHRTPVGPGTMVPSWTPDVDQLCVDDSSNGVGIYPCAQPPSKAAPGGPYVFTVKYLGDANFLPADASLVYYQDPILGSVLQL